MSLVKTKIYINSYPRCGNTYLHFSINRFIKLNNIKNIYLNPKKHEHSMLLNNNINQISILRNPLESITSYALMMLSTVFEKINDEELNIFIDDITKLYLDFMENLIKNDNILVIPFEDLIKEDINIIIKNILKYFEIEQLEPIKNLLNDDIKKIENDMKNIVQNNIYSSFSPRPYSLMPERESIINKVKNSKYYEKAFETYINNVKYFIINNKILNTKSVMD